MASGEPLSPAALALHVAVWNDDHRKIDELLRRAGPRGDGSVDLGLKDQRGNTAVMLAIKLGRKEAVRKLIAANAPLRQESRDAQGWETHSVASRWNDPELVREVFVASLRQLDEAWSRRAPRLLEALEQLPDLRMVMHWQFRSWVPLVSRLLPHDTLVLWKRGSSFRMDSTLLGMDGLRWQRGNVSVLLHGKDMPHPGEFFGLDHDHRTSGPLRRSFTHPDPAKMHRSVVKLLTEPHKETKFRSSRITCEPKMHWLRRAPMTATVGDFTNCAVYEMHNMEFSIFKRDAVRTGTDAAALQSADAAAADAQGLAPKVSGLDPLRRALDRLKTSTHGTGEGADSDGEVVDDGKAAAVSSKLDAAVAAAGIVMSTDDGMGQSLQRRVWVANLDTHAVNVPLVRGTRVGWCFSTEGYDIKFQVSFTPASADEEGARGPVTPASPAPSEAVEEAEEEDVVPSHRVDSHLEPQTGEFVAPARGTLRLVWDNTFSYMTGKDLSFIVAWQNAPAAEAVEAGGEEEGGAATALHFAFADTAANKAQVVGEVLAAEAEAEAAAEEAEEAEGAEAAEAAAAAEAAEGSTPAVPLVALPPVDRKEAMSFDEYFGRPPTAEEGPARAALFLNPQTKRVNKVYNHIKLCMCRDFPLSVANMLPLAEVMARTAQHFKTFQKFFESTFPEGAGFPVQFQVPVFPTIAATVSFLQCELVTPPAEMFQVPEDYKQDAYVDRSFFAQL